MLFRSENNPETPQERNQRYRNMLIETMSKYTKRKYDIVNSARKESVDQTQQDTSINSDEQNNEKVSEMNETPHSSPTQIRLISTPTTYIPDIPSLVNTSPYKSTDPFEVMYYQDSRSFLWNIEPYPVTYYPLKGYRDGPRDVFTNNLIDMSLDRQFPDGNLADDMFNAVTATEENNAAVRRQFENYDTDSTVDDPHEPPVEAHDAIQVDNFLNEAQQQINFENETHNEINDDNEIENIVLPIIEEIPPPEVVHVPPDFYHTITPETPDTTLFDYYYNLNVLRTNSHLKAIKQTPHQIIFDSGASTCATSDASLIDDIVYGNGVKATPAFGPPVTSQASGKYGPLGLDIILMPGMKETLISISELCHGGISGEPNGVFITSEGLRCFTIASVRHPMQLMHDHGKEIVRGFLSNGVYVYKGPDDNYNNGPVNNTVQVPPINSTSQTHISNPIIPLTKSIHKTTTIPLQLYLT